ncbi:MAG: SAM-dependent methyltransferase [Lachnospirales bacterium]
MIKKTQIVVSSLERKTSGKLALDEIKTIADKKGVQVNLIKWLSYGNFIVEIECTFKEFSKLCEDAVFIRHIFPICVFEEDVNILGNLDSILDMYDFDISKTVRVQGFSVLDSKVVKKSEIAISILDKLKARGIETDDKNGEVAVSFLLVGKNVYVGVSNTEDNLSSWTLGRVRLKRDDEQISRASFKLEECFIEFGITRKFKKAVDLGASPGGWTKVLADRGTLVYAVDPAKLDTRLKKYTNIKFFNMLSQEFVSKTSETFDLIVNDMKMDAIKSAEIMGQLQHLLEDDGYGIITLKLPEKKQKGKIIDALRELNKYYDVVKVKQLYHNREEVTVLFKKSSLE